VTIRWGAGAVIGFRASSTLSQAAIERLSTAETSPSLDVRAAALKTLCDQAGIEPAFGSLPAGETQEQFQQQARDGTLDTACAPSPHFR